MKITVCLNPSQVTDALVKDHHVVVIDVLRASSVIARALSIGAHCIIPADSPSAATSLLASTGRANALLCGERNGLKIEGFDLGNSPREYTRAKVEKKTLIFASTNGSRAMIRALPARDQVIASFNNLTTVAERIVTYPEVTILCAGKLGQASLEDTVCAGALVGLVEERMGTESTADTDETRMAKLLATYYRGRIRRLLDESTHGAYLASIGFGEDLDFCAAVDSIPILPVLREGRIMANAGD